MDAAAGTLAPPASSPARAAAERVALPACVALLAWGVVPFGAVHDWALWPLVGGTFALGAVSLLSARAARAAAIALAAAPFLAAVLVQLLPLPIEAIRVMGSGITDFLSHYDAAFANGVRAAHPLSIAPRLTLRAVLIFIALATLVVGLEAQLARRPGLVRRLAAAIVFIALPVALFALVQKATFNGKIYWFWESLFRGNSNYYGPFVNRNHFAGWMMLAASLTGGLLIAQIETMGKRVKPGWRNRVLWLSGEEASRILLTGAELLVMLVSVLWSMSRSGIGGTAVSLAILSTAAVRRGRRGLRRVVAAGAIVFVLVSAVAWRGAGTLADWYGRTETFEWRVRLWNDTLAPLSDFWLTGSGLNTYGTVMLLYPQSDQDVHAAQAHSDYLQFAVEAGLLAGIPAAILLALFVTEVRRRLRQPQDEMTWWIRLGAVAGICGIAVQELTEFSLQIPGVAVLFAVLAAIAIHEPALHPRRPAAQHA